MIKIAIIEDKSQEAKKLRQYILNYISMFDEYSNLITIDIFDSAEAFLESNSSSYDITFIDIELPKINGMDAAYRLREYNKTTIIIFVTNLTQFAIKGYQVNALDYIIKPVTYNDIISPLERALSLVSNRASFNITVRNSNGLVRLNTDDILYIEVLDHILTFHTAQGAVRASGSLLSWEQKLSKNDFMRCNSCYLVNPKYIKSVIHNLVILLDGTELKISKPRKKDFMLGLTIWIGRGNVV